MGVCGGRRRDSQVGVDVSQDLWQQGGNVCVDGSEPGVSRGGVFTAQHHRMLAVWRVKLQQSESGKNYNWRLQWWWKRETDRENNRLASGPQRYLVIPCLLKVETLHSRPLATCTQTTRSGVPVLQVWHGEVPADEAHFQTDDLPVFGRRRAAVFGWTRVLASAVAGRLWADTVPRQVSHQGRLLKERRHFTDVFYCWEAHGPIIHRLQLYSIKHATIQYDQQSQK